MGGLRLGVLGGTFDPIHLGHLVLAEEARRLLGLDIVLFVPAGTPWRKRARIITPAQHRLAMVALAIQDNPAFAISTVEVDRTGPSYTADTLEVLQRECNDGNRCELFFIMGVDALLDLPNWHQPIRIIRAAWLAVATRPGWDRVNLAELERRVPGLLARLRPVDMPLLQISSSDLRGRIARRQTVRYLIADAVREYVERHGLYAAASPS